MERAYDHSDFRDHLGAYVAGGLSPEERASFELHAAACAACAAVLAEAVAQDASLRELFSGARPAPDFEDRLVAQLRSARRPWPVLHPMVRRAATGVAAAVMLAVFGYVGSQSIRGNGLPLPWAHQGRGLKRVATTAEVRGVMSYAHGLGATTAPSEMATRFNLSVSDFDSDSRTWMYKDGRPGGEPASRRGYGDQTNRALSRAGDAPLASSNETNQPKEADDKAVVATNGAVRAPAPAAAAKPSAVPGGMAVGGRGRDAALGYGFGGGGAMAGGFGAAPAPAGGPGQPADTRNYAMYGRSTNAPAQAGAPGATQLGTVLRQGVELSGPVSGKDGDTLNKQLGKSAGFRPEAYFEADKTKEAKADVNASVDRFEAQSAAGAKPADEVRRKLTETVEQQVRAAEAPSPADAAGKAVALTGTAAAEPAAQAPTDPPATAPTAGRKIIRNGDMSFEVDSFDSAYVQITKIAGEEGGFVATTDSEKLANGKVRGTVTVRVPPDRLDTLVLKLRGLGDLKSSKLAAQDITKQYTDLESQLRASRAMEERLLNIIKTGKGEIKDLVEAEKQLGVYREKIEQTEGEIRYYNNLVSLSTLNVTLIERDIRTASMLSETEQVNMGVESQDVEKARAATIKAIEEAKGRIVESDLKKLEAGQFAARVTADVPPDAAGPLIDRMKQIGTVARLEVSRKQSAPEGTVAPTPAAAGGGGVRLERRDTRFLISLYNLANVAPRQTTTLNLAADDVEVAYRAILDQVKGAGGRIVTSQLNRPRPDQTTGTITFEAPAEGADVLLGAVRGAGEVMRLDVSQNPDAQNVTEAKRGFAVQIFSIASVAPRETTNLRVAARGVPDAFNKLREAVRSAAGARILSSQLAEADPANVTGTLDFEVRRADWASVETALKEAGQVVSRNVSRSADAENTVDTKIRLQVALVDEAALQPRETVTEQLAVADVAGRYSRLLEALAAAQARVLQSQLTEEQTQKNVTGTLVFDVRRENRAAVDRALAEAGDVVSRNVARSTDTQNTLDDKVRLSLTLTDAGRLPPRETTTLGMEAQDVEKAKEQIESIALSMGGRVVDSTLSREQNGRVIAKVVADVPLGRSIEMVRRTRDQGRVQFRRDARDEAVPQGSLARARVEATIANEELIVEGDRGLGATVREGLRTSITGLLWSLQLIVVGLFLVAPWALILYFAWRVLRRGRGRKGVATTPATV